MNLKSTYKQLSPIFYSNHKAIGLKNPKLISKNQKLLDTIGIDLNDEELILLLNGKSAHTIDSFAMAYSGHQFGFFVDNLGDGRALNLGKKNGFNLQTKGSGVTKYSRNGDGRAILRSSIREYILSEAMYGLGIPTSRAVALIYSDSTVYREGNEQCAIVLRASSSWIRFGTFEFAYTQKDPKLLKELADYVIDESYPHLKEKAHKYDEMVFEITDKTIDMIVKWQSFGFMHGVMNTDNMSIEGLTIDYGPYAFMEEFQKDFICNHSDRNGRYSFSNQAFIARWNLLVLAEVLKPIINHELCENYINQFIGKFRIKYYQSMCEKIGISYHEDDAKFLLDMFSMLEECNMDYTVFFYYLSHDNINGIRVMSSDINTFNIWFNKYLRRIKKENISKEKRLKKMQTINPKYVFKNYMLQDAIDAARNGDYTLVNDFLEIAHNPYAEHKAYEKYALPTPKELGGYICSCSS